MEKQTEAEVKQAKTNQIMNGVNVWASFYRANPHRFARDYLGLTLDRFQQILLCMMFKYSNVIYLASRGHGKTFLIAIFCVIQCILYPGSRICLASKTRKQATEVIDKIREILMPNSANLRLEIAEIQVNQANAYVSFRNASHIVVVTAAESARHNRATVLVVDEFRMVDKGTIFNILRRFLTTPRHPGYLDKPEYKNYPKEPTKEIYASSCWYESHWSYEFVRSYAVNMVRGRSYFCCSLPYQLAIKEGRLDRIKIEDEMSESTFNSVTFQMEMEALFFGQGDGGLYSFDEIDKTRKLPYPQLPRAELHKISDKRLSIQPKKEGEIRILSADIALISSNVNNNDATSIFVNYMVPGANGRYNKNFVYTRNDEGLRTDVQALIIRKLFAEFDCDCLVLDVKGLGIGILDALMSDIYDPNEGVTYPPLSCYNNDELASRCVDPSAPKVIWAIQGSAEFNSKCALGLREAFKQGEIRTLISEYDADEYLSDVRGYASMTPAEQLEIKLPYIHTSLMVNELINLDYETKNGVVRVKEKGQARKDRYSSLSYNMFVAKAIEREKLQEAGKSLENSLMLYFKAPKRMGGLYGRKQSGI